MCAMLVFFKVGTHQPADVPPIRNLTVAQAESLMRNHGPWPSNVYPVLKPCDDIK